VSFLVPSTDDSNQLIGDFQLRRRANGLSVFDLLRYLQHNGAAMLCASAVIEERKDLLGKLLRCASLGNVRTRTVRAWPEAEGAFG
jgi:hypothetical protein